MTGAAGGLDARPNAADWLAQAATGGLPEPVRRRWQPLRVGIVNLWEYDEAEFWFADGRLVLRGGNGAGKTKVLELTTLMLLRGEITPSVLDPFGSQHRTMRYNLLPTGDADDPRPPSDSGLGYAWVEFGRLDDADRAQFFVCGIGASARRGSGTAGAVPWQWITTQRPGKELALSRAGRPLEMKELRKFEAVDVLQNAARYRARLAGELFGLDGGAYDNLTELLKQLRKPKLGERLNPATLAETLSNALPPLAGHEIDQLAEGWDRLEGLRKKVDATKEAAAEVARFVRQAWLPWARVVVRRRANVFTTARYQLERTTSDKNAAQGVLEQAKAEVGRLSDEVEVAVRERADANTALRELLESPSYVGAKRAVDRVEGLKRTVADLRARWTTAKQNAEEQNTELARRAEVAATVREQADAADERVRDEATALGEAAAPAGLAESASRYVPKGDVAALRVDLDRRSERLRRLRRLLAEFDQQDRKADLSAQRLEDRRQALHRAEGDERRARQSVEASVDELRQQIREWAAGLEVTSCTPEQIEHWCDLVSDLTEVDAAARAGGPVPAMRGHEESTKDTLRYRRDALVRQRVPLETEHRDVETQLAEVESREDTPPAEPTLWKRAERPDTRAGRGAPFWRCVQPVDGFDGERLDVLEAALAASGLLDAWLTPDGMLRTDEGVVVSDVGVHPAGANKSEQSLAAILEPTPCGGVAAPTVTAVLQTIAWCHDGRTDADTASFAEDGSWRIGALAGRAEAAQPASFLGATARKQARERLIGELRVRKDQLAADVSRLTSAIDGVEAELETVKAEASRIPGQRRVTDAVATWDERRRQVDGAKGGVAGAAREHQANETVRDQAWAALSEFAATHRFPVRDLDAVGQAIETYRAAIGRLENAVTTARLRGDAADTAEQERLRQAGEVDRAAAEATALSDELRQAGVRLQTAEEALGSDHADLLRRKDVLDVRIETLDGTITESRNALEQAKISAATANQTLETHEERRAQAEQERDAALASWWEPYDAGLADAVGLGEPERRSVESGRAAVIAARKDLADIADEGTEDKALRRCYRHVDELRHLLAPTRDAKVVDDTDNAAGGRIPNFVVLAEGESGWQRPDVAADTLADRVRELEANYDIEQQRVLATLLESTFIEHLKDRLDYTEHTFVGINNRLQAHPTRHGHAVRLRHEPDPSDPDASAVVAALGKGYQQLNPERQQMVRGFLSRKIDEARADAAADGAADWKEQLATALDYRRWLRIWLEYRPGAQATWRPFDRAMHGAKSGGEKVVLLSQPLFAATVVAFDAADPMAPRWVWLDEAMTGIDAQYKASFMGLTAEFDLDVMLTAHDEWCTYPTVPAVAIYDLSRHPHLPGVDAQPHLWCGGEMTEVVMLAADPGGDLLAEEGLFASMDSDDEP